MGALAENNEKDVELIEKKEKDKFEARIPGSLSIIELTEQERNLLLDYLSVSTPLSYPDYIWSLLGDQRWLSFFDMLEGLTMKFPSRQALVKVINYIKIYAFLNSRNFTEEAYEIAAKLYKKRVPALKRIVNKVEKVLERVDTDD